MKTTHNIRRGDCRYRTVKQHLRLAGLDFVPGESKGWGFWLSGTVNSRTNSEWHSTEEASRLLRTIRTGSQS